METITLRGRHSFKWKPLFLVEAVRFSVNCFLSFQWKLFLYRKLLAFSGSNSFQWKLLLSIDGISFIGSYSFYWKPFILVEAIPFSFFRKAFVIGGNHCIQLKPIFLEEAYYFQQAWWKLLLLIETFPFSGSHSFQCFNIFTSRSYHKLPEYLNINDSVRSLKMANLPCIHIPGEVFQNSEGYLEPSRASGVESF